MVPHLRPQPLPPPLLPQPVIGSVYKGPALCQILLWVLGLQQNLDFRVGKRQH